MTESTTIYIFILIVIAALLFAMWQVNILAGLWFLIVGLVTGGLVIEIVEAIDRVANNPRQE